MLHVTACLGIATWTCYLAVFEAAAAVIFEISHGCREYSEDERCELG